jgi:predicted nucleic acid-binding protein
MPKINSVRSLILQKKFGPQIVTKHGKVVVVWISIIPKNLLFLSVFTLAEIHRGVEKLPDGKKKTELHNWVNSDLIERFDNKILLFASEAARKWGRIQGQAEIELRLVIFRI